MELKKAMKIVIADILNNNQGGVYFSDIEEMSEKEKQELAEKLVESDEFLERFTSVAEDAVSEFLEDFGDEYGIFQ